ncbi:pyrimidine monooxygenase RutA [Mesorhizobium sp. L-8-10]|nr:pyrimidine monooxygenase RutA [Mesorhizobium sp. L-8-10]
MPTYEHNLQVAVEAERQGFDMVLSMMKYRGFGGETGFWDSCLESFTLMAGLAAATKRVELFPSVTLPAHHPAVVARMVATIDDISGGRCGLNIVTGWNKAEYEQMGLWRGSGYYTSRYDYAKEFLAVMKGLWENGSFSYEGEHFHVSDCQAYPQPRHPIRIVCAGQSPAGARFVAEHGDRNFVQAGPDRLAQIVANLKEAGTEFGRKVGTFAVFHLIADETDEKAAAITRRIVERADLGAINNFIASARLDTNPKGISEFQATGMSRPPEEGNSAFMTIPVIHGSYETAAEKIEQIFRDTGIDGMLLSFPDFVNGIHNFGERIRPRLSAS